MLNVYGPLLYVRYVLRLGATREARPCGDSGFERRRGEQFCKGRQLRGRGIIVCNLGKEDQKETEGAGERGASVYCALSVGAVTWHEKREEGMVLCPKAAVVVSSVPCSFVFASRLVTASVVHCPLFQAPSCSRRL